MGKRIVFCKARNANVNKETCCPDKECSSCEGNIQHPHSRRTVRNATEQEQPESSWIVSFMRNESAPSGRRKTQRKVQRKRPFILNFDPRKEENEDAVLKIFEYQRQKDTGRQAQTNLKPLSTLEIVEDVLSCIISPDEFVEICKRDPDFIFSEQGIFNVRLLRGDLCDTDKKAANRASIALGKIGKSLASKGYRDKPKKEDKAILIRDRDIIIDASPSKLNIQEEKRLANFKISKENALDAATIERYDKDVGIIDCGNGRKAYFIK